MMQLRTKRIMKFEEKRTNAAKIVKASEKVIQERFSGKQKLELETQQRGYLGQQLKQFSELQMSLQKLHTNFTSIVSGEHQKAKQIIVRQD
jgi:hypothetical protein